ncbi:MAG: AI-2E family transporter [Patescibacteria group bacterium]|jgi:predicted PurR-regulated permease PerM|nr:AI-2E family transporter [Patescibacteria group bacterium]
MQITTRNIFKILGAVTLFTLLLLFIYAAAIPLSWIAAAFLIALLLNPLVGFLQKFMPKKNRIAAILLTIVIIIAILIFAILVTLQPLIQQFGSLTHDFTKHLDSLKTNQNISDFIDQASKVPAPYKETVSNIGAITLHLTLSLANALWAAITITMLAIFMLINPQRIVDTVISYVPNKHQRLLSKLSDALTNIVPKYFGGTLIIAFIVAVFTFIPLVLLRVPYPLALATSMLFFDLIPLIGATLGYAFIIGFCLLIGMPEAAIILLIYILIYQLVEDNVIVPLIQHKTVSISPLSVLIAILIGAAVFGMLGALLAIPTAAMIKITYDALKEEGYLKTSEDT